MKTLMKPFVVFFTAFVLTACASVDERLKREFDQIRRGPAGAPYKNITNFSSALQCMDNLMLKHRVKSIPILIESIDDKTDAVSAGTRDMLISSISEMTTRSRGIKIIAYGKDSTNLISFMKVAKQNKAFEQMPLFDIQGSISQHDENIVSGGNSLGLFARKEGGTGFSNSTSLSTIAMDLNVLDVSDMSVVPGVNARNSIAILRKGTSFDMDASINKLGVYFDISMNRTEGKTQALRNLVELSAIELIGKLTKVPYEECLGAKRHYARKTNYTNVATQQTLRQHESEGATQNAYQASSEPVVINVAKPMAEAPTAQIAASHAATSTANYAARSAANPSIQSVASYETEQAQVAQTVAVQQSAQQVEREQAYARQAALTQTTAVETTQQMVQQTPKTNSDDSGIIVHKCCKHGS